MYLKTNIRIVTVASLQLAEQAVTYKESQEMPGQKKTSLK